MEIRECLNCGKPIQGRADKKFCDDSCRNAYNNQAKQVSTNIMRNINNALRKNRIVLKDILGNKDTAKIHGQQLQEKGYLMKYHTHTYTTKKGDTYLYNYEYGILPTGNDWYLIVKQD
jgi:predicted nucleic acid-binding Zn ribbon protein